MASTPTLRRHHRKSTPLSTATLHKDKAIILTIVIVNNRAVSYWREMKGK